MACVPCSNCCWVALGLIFVETRTHWLGGPIRVRKLIVLWSTGPHATDVLPSKVKSTATTLPGCSPSIREILSGRDPPAAN
ncbi:MAG: hypothetical protein WBL68_15490 [Nitrososphaeraceae archaeon]